MDTTKNPKDPNEEAMPKTETIKSVEELFDELKQLLGVWKGVGRGGFPTIERFRYCEESKFTANDDEQLLHFEQRTWLLDDNDRIIKAIHWESGFFIPTEAGISNRSGLVN